jgi:tRNA wybutosine-synthesizing protein 3
LTKKKFFTYKKRAMKRLKDATIAGRIDTGITPILELINSQSECFSTSSCAGRIIILEIPSIGHKREAQFLGKWHRTVALEEVLSSARKGKKGEVWLLAQPPIFHVVSENLTAASELLKVAIASGFKNSCFKSVGKKIVVELASTERIDVPLGVDGKVVCGEEYLMLLLDSANYIMAKATSKIRRLEKNLSCGYRDSEKKSIKGSVISR